MASADSQARIRHWAKTRNLTIVILALWVLFGILAPWFAKDLDAFTFMGFKLGYYMVVQGSLIAFVLLIWVQNMIQDKIDDEYEHGSN
jgi:putative solute:sodium symporter small subunit